ncbi:alpha/beta hydrolase [Indiicoccus explosivorum]|uniref:alpha/beta hydrolase n=1 Tax=Indiicoccus explosivorum TaxID=1917864 RepID=UPI000B430A3E|nr:alpha/beta hydrolase [Indiicoccus explosivorum]
MMFTEQEIRIEGAAALAGTLTLPKEGAGPFPAVVFVHGSGDIDRNGNAKRLPINAYKELGDLAASLGFATVRYDKRGVGKSEGDFYSAGLFDLIDDVERVVQFAASHPAIDENGLILLGHSEGALIAPAVNKRQNVQGMILIAGTAEPLGDTTAWQRAQMKEDMQTKTGFQGFILRLLKVDQKIEKMNTQMAEKLLSSDEPVMRFKGQKINAKWNREHGQYDVRDYLPDVTCPVLAVTGQKDVQVKPEQVQGICGLVSGPCEARLIPDMTHILRKTDKDPSISSIMNDYKKQIKEPVDDELKQVIGDWLRAWKSHYRQQ